MKRIFDILFSSILLLIAAFPMCMISIIIFITSPGPIIFWSNRVGQFNSIFSMPKFRTMHTMTPLVSTDLLESPSQHITKIGAILRKWSLDELPQLFTVLFGRMSFVGPRPALFNQLTLIDMRTKCGVHILKPGIVGWAQINGRDNLNDSQKVLFDTEYLNKQSLFFDLYIVFRSIFVVFKGKNVRH